jgi:hypothetical protein
MVFIATSLARFRSRIKRVHKLLVDFKPYARLMMTRALLLMPSTAALVWRVSK